MTTENMQKIKHKAAECEDGEYEIEVLGKNVSIVVSFDELPVILHTMGIKKETCLHR